MGKKSVAKSSQSNAKRSSSANTLSKSHSNGMVRNNSLQTYPDTVSPKKTRSKLKMNTIESAEVTSKTTVMNHVIKNVSIYLIDLIHTDILTRNHRKELQRLRKKQPKSRVSICSSSFDSHHSDISGSSFRINDRELRSLPVRDERVKRESLFLKYIQEPNSNFSELNSSQGGAGNASIVEKFYGRESQVEDGIDEEKKWRFWNWDLSSGESSRHNSATMTVKSYESSDIFSSDESEIFHKRKRRKQTKKLPPPSQPVLSGKKKARKPTTPPLDEATSTVEFTPQSSTSTSVAPKDETQIQAQLSTTKLDESSQNNHKPKITMQRTVVTWQGNKKTTWILNVMPKSEAERTGKLDIIKKMRLSRNPLNNIKKSSGPRKYGPRDPKKKKIKDEKKKNDTNKKTKAKDTLQEEKLLCCDGPCQCNPEDDLVVHKLPSMPAIDIHMEANKQIKPDPSVDVQPVTKKREASPACDSSNDLPNYEPPTKLRKLNDGKKYPEIIEDTILSPGNAISLIPTPRNPKPAVTIPKIDLNIEKCEEKLKVAFDNWAKIPELTSLISPDPSIVEDNKKQEEPKLPPAPTGSRRNKIIFDIKNDDKKQPAPLTVKNVKAFSQMIQNQLKKDLEVDKTVSKVRLRISTRLSTKEDSSNKNRATNDDKKSKKSRRDWKKESSQANDATNSSSESSPIINKYMRSNSDDSLPRFGQILASASNPSTSDTPIERRVFNWIYKDLDISDTNIKELDLSDNSSSTSSEALKIDEKYTNAKDRNEVDGSVLEIDHLLNADNSIENVTFGDLSTTGGKSVNENLDETRQSVAEEDDKMKDHLENESLFVETQKDDDTSSISSSSSSDSNKSSDSSSSSSSSSSSASSQTSSSSISSKSTNVNKSLKIVEPETSPCKIQESSVCVNDEAESKNEEINNQKILDKCDDDKGYVSIIDDNNSINSNTKCIDEEKSLIIDDKQNNSIQEERKLETDKYDEKRLEIDSVLDDNDNIEKNKLIELESNRDDDLKDVEEKGESDDDLISLYAESLFMDKMDKPSVSPELPTFGNLSKPPSPQNGYNRMESNTFNNYYQLTEQEFDNDYQNVNIQTNCKGLTTRRFRNRLNNQTSSKSVDCDLSYARSPNSHTIDDNNLDSFNNYSTHNLDNNYNIIRNNKLQQRYEQNVIKQKNVFDPMVQNSNPAKDYIKHFFVGNCFSHLKFGSCKKVDKCRHNHSIGNKLQCIYLESPKNIYMTLIYAFEQNFHFYLRNVYLNAVQKLDVQTIYQFFRIILNLTKREMIPDYIRWTIDALIVKKRTLKNIVNVLTDGIRGMAKMIKPIIAPSEIFNVAINHLATKIETGGYWETFRPLIISQAALSHVIISYVLQESIECSKPFAHLKDVETFLLIPYLCEDNFSKVGAELYSKFMSLIDKQTQNDQAVYAEKVVEIRQKPPEAITLASPDLMDISSLSDNVNPFINSMNANKYIPERDLIQLQNNNNNNNNLKTKCIVNSVDSQAKIQEKVETKPDAVPSTSKADNTLKPTQKLFANKYKLIPIDAPKPKSIYENHVWLLRSDLENIQTAIKKNDYDEIVKVLSFNKRSQNQPFVRGFYTILCREIMESVRHLNEIIQRTVRAGLYVRVNRLLTDTGIMLLITLIDNNYWVLAYHLLQLLNLYLINTDDHTVEFVYVSVEIYLANHKPLKAVELMKRNNMMIGDVEKWKITSNNVKKALKVHGNIMRILFKALSYSYPQYAFELYRNIIDQQKNAFYPINLTHVITDIINTVLADIINVNNNDIENIDYIFTELSKIMLSHNIIIYDKSLRDIISEVYHTDEKLSRQLFKYATRLGVYTTVKYEADSAVTLTISTNLSQEEMYLLLVESFQSLKEQIGCNIYMLQPRKLIFYLNFEIIPSGRMLYKNNINLKNNLEIIKATKKILARVFEKFDPKLKMLSRTVGQRVCRLVSYTVFPHLIKDDD